MTRRITITMLAIVALVLVAPVIAAAAAGPRAPAGTLATKPATTTRRAVITLDSSAVTGAAQMQFRDEGGAWGEWLPFAAQYQWTLPGTDGLKTVHAQYLGGDGSPSGELTAQVFLDRKRPKTIGYAHEARRKTRIALTYKVVDPKPSCGWARVIIRVYRYGKLFTTFKRVEVPTNRKQKTRTFKCSWSRGWYTYRILATDIAGNRYATAGVGVLFVK